MKKALIPVMTLLALFAVAPVMAIGPQKAAKNPNIMITPEGAELSLPSGIVNEWIADTDESVMDFVHIKNAAKFKIGSAGSVELADMITLFTDPVAALEYENKWGYVSYEVLEAFFEWLISVGYPITPEEVEEILSVFSDGMYIMFVNAGG